MLTFHGHVERGEGFARTLDCPTANIHIDEGMLIPSFGVYLAYASLDGESVRHPSLVCVSDTRSTNLLKIEVHILNQTGLELLGKGMTVYLAAKLRDLVDYTTQEDMRALIAKDKIEANEWFQKNICPIARS